MIDSGPAPPSRAATMNSRCLSDNVCDRMSRAFFGRIESVTAMMAFFLVLWLLNSTNKEAKISIRNYFNPIKLAEASMTRKGIIDEKDAQPAAAPRCRCDRTAAAPR